MALVPASRPGFTRIAGLTATIAAWTIVATSVFADSTAVWLAFGSALGYAGLSVLALILHEVHTERGVHHLEVKEGERAKA